MSVGIPFVGYDFYYTKRGSHLTICSAFAPNSKPLYFAEMHAYHFGTPDVQLRRIPESISESILNGTKMKTAQGLSGIVVGLAKVPLYFGSMKFGFTDPNDFEREIVWNHLEKTHFFGHGQYDFWYINTLKGTHGPPSRYSWQRTNRAEDGVTGSTFSRLMNMNSFKLVDYQAGRMVALFHGQRASGWRQQVGSLQIFGGVEKDLELMILLSLCAIKEDSRRRENAGWDLVMS